MEVKTELSGSALAVLRSRSPGWNAPVDESNLEAYRELERAGIMYAVSGSPRAGVFVPLDGRRI